MKAFRKKCPECGNPQNYGCKKTFIKSLREGWICRRCAVSKSHAESPRTFFGNGDYKQKMSESLKQARMTNSYGDKFKMKCRENKLKQLEVQGTQRTFNDFACKFMDQFNVEFGTKLQHGLNGGEIQFIGYSLDGYDKEKNIVFEYDEPNHNKSSRKTKDIIRQNRIINIINPTLFIRYDEASNKLYKVKG